MNCTFEGNLNVSYIAQFVSDDRVYSLPLPFLIYLQSILAGFFSYKRSDNVGPFFLIYEDLHLFHGHLYGNYESFDKKPNFH